MDAITIGDARLLSARLPDASVDLVFTDPVYERAADYRWLAAETRRLLRPGGRALVFAGIGHLEATFAACREGGMPVQWVGGIYKPGACQRAAKNTFSHWCALLWLSGTPVTPAPDMVMSNLSEYDGSHRWKKFSGAIGRILAAFSRPGDLVWDPFTGGGTIPCAARSLGRRVVAFEWDAAAGASAVDRLRRTQLPLPMPAGTGLQEAIPWE